MLSEKYGVDVTSTGYMDSTGGRDLITCEIAVEAWVPETRIGMILYGVEVYDATEYEKVVASIISDVACGIMDTHKNRRDRIRAAFDWVIDNFDYTYGIEGVFTEDNALEHLNRGTTNCGGFAGIFSYVVLAMDMRCRVVNGGAGDWFHAWNEVYLDNVPYYIDPAWGRSSENRYQWFLVEDPTFSGTHEELNVYEWIERSK